MSRWVGLLCIILVGLSSAAAFGNEGELIGELLRRLARAGGKSWALNEREGWAFMQLWAHRRLRTATEVDEFLRGVHAEVEGTWSWRSAARRLPVNTEDLPEIFRRMDDARITRLSVPEVGELAQTEISLARARQRVVSEGRASEAGYRQRLYRLSLRAGFVPPEVGFEHLTARDLLMWEQVAGADGAHQRLVDSLVARYRARLDARGIISREGSAESVDKLLAGMGSTGSEEWASFEDLIATLPPTMGESELIFPLRGEPAVLIGKGAEGTGENLAPLMMASELRLVSQKGSRSVALQHTSATEGMGLVWDTAVYRPSESRLYVRRWQTPNILIFDTATGARETEVSLLDGDAPGEIFDLAVSESGLSVVALVSDPLAGKLRLRAVCPWGSGPAPVFSGRILADLEVPGVFHSPLSQVRVLPDGSVRVSTAGDHAITYDLWLP